MVQVQPRVLSVPAITPRPGELLDLAEVSEGIEWIGTTGLYETFHCIPTGNIATLPCPAVLLGAPTMTAPSTNTTGGTLAAGTYRAVITAVNSRGETTVSNEVSQVTTGATSRIIWNWNDVSGETSYNLYVTAVNGAAGTEKFLINLAAGTTTYNWTGTPAIGTTSPPTSNTAVVSVTKTFGSSSFQDAFTFAAYAGQVCKGIGYDQGSLDELRSTFEANESVAVEKALMQQRFVQNGVIWAAPPDLTPAGGAVQPEVGLAILEGHASGNYAGVPTIHAPRSIGSLLLTRAAIERSGNVLLSKQGSKVASGGGYEAANQSPAGVAAPAGEKWVYASGEVSVYRGPVEAHNQMDRSTNELFSLVERQYTVAVDCYTAAVRVKVN